MVIDPHGLFHGKRLARCSDLAQFYYPRLLLASNGYARIELDFERIRCSAFPSIRSKPTDEILRKTFDEYVQNFLLFFYEADGQAWGQWDVNEDWLPRYKTAVDRRSPAPDPENFKKWVLLGKSQRAKDFGNFRKFSENFQGVVHGVGVGVGVGGGVGECITEVVGPVESSENVENPEEKPANEDESQRHQIAQRGQERLLQLRKERSQKEPTAIGDLFAENLTQVGEKIKQQMERITGRKAS